MKKLRIIVFLFMILAVVSCEKNEEPYIPTVDDIENIKESETIVGGTETLGPTEVDTKPIESFVYETTPNEHSGVKENDGGPNLSNAKTLPIGVNPENLYDQTTYDGVYGYLIDKLYTMKQGIIQLEKKKMSTRFYEKYEAKIDDFLADKSINYYLSNSFTRDDAGTWYLNADWSEQFYLLLQLDSERLLADEKLIELFKLDIKRWCVYDYILPIEDRLVELEKLNLELFDRVNPGKAILTGVSYDSETMRTVVNINIGSSDRYVYTLGESEITRFTTKYTLMNKDDVLTLPVNYEGNIHVACIDENGLLGKPSTYYIEAQTALLPDTVCEFECASLETSVYSYLGLNDDASITPKALLGIKEIYINGSDIYFNGDELNESIMNGNDSSATEGISLEDFDVFPALEKLTIINNKIADFSGYKIKHLSMLKLIDCGISDISFLIDNYIEDLYLENNEINDATVLATSHCLDTIILTNNPLKSMALPAKEMSKIDISNTKIEALDFLNNVTNIVELNCVETEITDVSILGDFRKLELLYLPNDVESDFASILTNLVTFYIGDKKIK